MPVENICQKAIQLIDGRLIMVLKEDRERKIQIWDVEKQELLSEVAGFQSSIEAFKISGDGSKLFCMCFGKEFIEAWFV